MKRWLHIKLLQPSSSALLLAQQDLLKNQVVGRRAWGDQDPIRSEKPGPDTAEVKGSHMLASRASLPRPGADSLFPNWLEKCQRGEPLSFGCMCEEAELCPSEEPRSLRPSTPAPEEQPVWFQTQPEARKLTSSHRLMKKGGCCC